MQQKPIVSIVIPCLNEKDTIARVLDDVFKNCLKYFGKNYEIIVADNGSTDGSLDIINRIKGITVVNVPIRGYGAALHWGIMKADGSYPFSNLSKFKKEIDKANDLVLGSRMKGKIEKNAMPFLHRYIGTPILTFLIKIIYKIPTTDCNSGMRMIKKDFYKKLNMKSSGMEWASELLLKTALVRGRYLEVPIRFLKDKRQKNPHLNTWADGWRHLKSILFLKPNVFVYLMFLFMLLSLLSYPASFGFLSLFILLFVTTLYSYLALIFLTFATDKKSNQISIILNNNYLVPVVIVFILLSFLIIYFLPDFHLGTKMLLAAVISMTIIWVFMIETIKTHLINRLP